MNLEQAKEEILGLDFIVDKDNYFIHYVKICDVMQILDNVYNDLKKYKYKRVKAKSKNRYKGK